MEFVLRTLSNHIQSLITMLENKDLNQLHYTNSIFIFWFQFLLETITIHNCGQMFFCWFTICSIFSRATPACKTWKTARRHLKETWFRFKCKYYHYNCSFPLQFLWYEPSWLVTFEFNLQLFNWYQNYIFQGLQQIDKFSHLASYICTT